MWGAGVPPGLIYLHRKKNKKTCPAALAGTVEGGSHVLHHPLPLSFINPHMDVISSNLSGFVKWQPDRETEELCFVGRTWHSGTRCCDWQGMHWQKHWQLHSLQVACFELDSSFCGMLPSVTILPSYSWLVIFTCWHVNQAGATLKREDGIENAEMQGLTLAPPTIRLLSAPKTEVWNWTEMEGRQAAELKAQCDRLEKVNVPKINHRNYCGPWETCEKLIKLESAIIHEAIMGIRFRFSFLCRAIFFPPFFSTGRGKLTRDWLPECYGA